MKIVPFFINSNICMNQNDISTYEKFMLSIAGNTGNSYITYALIKELFGGLVDIHHIQNIYEYNFDNSEKDIDYINNQATHVFLILQDQIRIQESYGLKLPYRKIMDFISKLNKPVIIAGLGANSFNGFDPQFHKKLDPNLIDFLKFLSDHCIEIGIRGHYTEEILHKVGVKNVRVIGCPSFFEMGSNRRIEKTLIEDLRSVILTQRLPIHTPKIHKIMQDFQEEDVIKPIAFNRIENSLSQHHLQSFYDQTYHIFSDIDSWKNFVKNYKFALGNRVHGSILSINAGVPALCMNVDSRATEMCNFIKIPHMPGLKFENENEILKIYEKLDFTAMNEHYPALYNNFVDFLHKNNLQHSTENKDVSNKQTYIKQPALNLYSDLFYANLDNKIKLNQLVQEIENLKQQLGERSLKSKKRSPLEKIFSVRNEEKNKVVCICGIKIRFRRRKHV